MYIPCPKGYISIDETYIHIDIHVQTNVYTHLHSVPCHLYFSRVCSNNTAPCSDADSQFNFPDGAGPASGQGLGDGSSPMSASSSTPDLMAKSPGDATPPLPPPSPVAK